MEVVLVEPQIPQNLGSIARTCAATCTPLHIVGKTPFEITDKKVQRAGLDYWPYVSLSEHKTWDEFYAQFSGGKTAQKHNIWLLSKFGKRIYYSANFSADDALVFGSETTGLSEEFIREFPEDQLLTIPMPCQGVRSLNLSNAVAIVLYEARRQLRMDEGKEDWIRER
jgi:tRNA (cytidine/uridine-2'-O-)-methyltransferase